MSDKVETLEFQAEARQLLELMIHSIYSDKDIFLRELISNASDALDKARLEALVDKDREIETADQHITIEVDREQRTLTVRDNGIGMSRDDVVKLIGTIAKSGTAELLRKLKDSADAAAAPDLIGQFGVGFYATFMVADTVTLLTRRAGETGGTRWESAGTGTYVIEAVDDAPQGTAVTVHLKPEDSENHLFDYTEERRIREIVKRYSDFIAYPIRMAVESTGEDGATSTDVQTLNSMKALWARPRNEVDQAEYNELYRHISHDWNDPLEVIHMKGEGTFEYEALLFLPASAPFDLYARDSNRGIQLYVRRVFIMDDCKELMPNYLRFVKGVVDAHDLSLNISREILQQDRQIQLVRRRLVKKVLSTLSTLRANDAERYLSFWKEFGAVLKEGLVDDIDNQEALLDVISVASTRDPEKLTTLREYVERMKDGQTDIYYMTGESRSLIENSPHIEAFLARGYEVLILTDPVDEVWVERVSQFDGRPLRSIAKGQVDLGAKDEEETSETDREQREQEFGALLAWLTETLGDDVKEVRLSTRLTSSPACIVGDAYDMTPALEKMYRATGQPVPHQKRILELNPTHPLVTGLRTAHGKDADAADLAGAAELLHGMAVLAEGGELRDPSRFTRLLADRLATTL